MEHDEAHKKVDRYLLYTDRAKGNGEIEGGLHLAKPVLALFVARRSLNGERGGGGERRDGKRVLSKV